MYKNSGSCAVKTDGSNSDCASATSKTDCDQATTSGGAANAANACVFTADTNVQKERVTSWCKDGESMSADPATPAKCSSIPGTLAWCKTADANKFTNGLISDSKGVPVVGLMCKANPCTPADDGATCCEDTSGSGGGTNGGGGSHDRNRDVTYVCKVHTDFLEDHEISFEPFGAPEGREGTCKGLMGQPLFEHRDGAGADFSSANDCASYSAKLNATIELVASSGCCGPNKLSTCSTASVSFGKDKEADGVGKKIGMMSMALAGLALVVGCL